MALFLLPMLDTSLVPDGAEFTAIAASHRETHTHAVNQQKGLTSIAFSIVIFNATTLPGNLHLEVVNEQSARRLNVC